ncbi:MAG: serine hydrolase domain-containing protein, partial [Bacteroidota bacterium]
FKMIRLYPCTLVLLLSFLFLFQLSSNAQTWFMTNVEGELQSFEQRRAAHAVNGTGYVVVRNFEIDTTMYEGFRDAENALPVNRNTLFQMGSMTGALTKFAVLRLVNDGIVKLDAPANNYLKSWQLDKKSFTDTDPVTVRDLLTQQRGLTNVYKPKGYAKGVATPTLLQILNGDAPSNLPDMQLKKNKRNKKSNSMANTMVLQQLLEDVHGKDFTTIIEERVFEPLDMQRSYISADRPETGDDNIALAYDQNNQPVAGGNLVYPELAVSGLWSTAEDYTKFVLHLFKAAKGMDNRTLDVDLAKAAIQPESGSISLVFFKNETSYWGGAPEGYYSQFSGDADAGWMVIATTNKQLAWQHVNWELIPRGIDYAKRKKTSNTQP